MKKMRIFKFIAIALIVFAGNAFAGNVSISTPNTTLVLKADTGEKLQYLYYGQKLSGNDVKNIGFYIKGQDVYPEYGQDYSINPAIAVTHADGNMSLVLKVSKIENTVQDNAEVLAVTLNDEFYPFEVVVKYKAYKDVDVIETWTEIKNKGKKSIKLRKYASANIPIRRGNVWVSHLYGAWASEAQLVQEELKAGIFEIKNTEGVRNSYSSHAEVMFSLDGKPSELNGQVIVAALCYSGNYKLDVNTDAGNYHNFTAGICEDNAELSLKAGNTFVTPVLALSYSNLGLSGGSRNMHSWARKYRLAHGNVERKILLNSWEGVYLKINEPAMYGMIKDIADIGGELFVMDDGWFGDKYPRNKDNSSLGDWTVCIDKLPNGVEGLLDKAKENNIKFGIWIEPEMVNIASELYEKHPDWVIGAKNRKISGGRGGTQLNLDLSNPKVQDFVFGVFDDIMTKYPNISYIKWDANNGKSTHGSSYLSDSEQSRLFIDYHAGLDNVCKRIRAKYPDVTIQECASGGGRANYGLMQYFDEFWVSDNTDALQRIYMQWGTSYFFPAIAMASHISADVNHQTGRAIPLKYRIDVAMSARLGMELQPSKMSEKDKTICKNAISEYKQIRPIVQFGNIYRLVSPYDNQGIASLMYVNDNKSESVLYWWKVTHCRNLHVPVVKLSGLDVNKMYKITQLNKVGNKTLSFEGVPVSGSVLMSNGLDIPVNDKKEYESYVLKIESL